MKRHWFQIHLSTAIVMMIVASVMLWINFRERTIAVKSPFSPLIRVHGWPIGGRVNLERNQYVVFIADSKVLGSYKKVYNGITFEMFLDWFVPNTLCGIAVIALAGVAVEIALRRRERRLPHPVDSVIP
jgi:hypothetical protein